MSFFSNLVGKIPVVGHALNQVGKVLPSVGSLAGGVVGGGAGQLIGGLVDPHASKLQKVLSSAAPVAAAAIGGGDAAMGGGGFLDKLGGIAKNVGGSLMHTMQNADGSFDWGKLAKAGLAGTALLGQHQSTNAANQYFA